MRGSLKEVKNNGLTVFIMFHLFLMFSPILQ